MNKDERIKVMEVFIERKTKRDIAVFIVNIEGTIAGLIKNIKFYQEELKRLYEEMEK